jgi:hypothetical protein
MLCCSSGVEINRRAIIFEDLLKHPVDFLLDVDQALQLLLGFTFERKFLLLERNTSEFGKMADENENRIEPTKAEDGIGISQVEKNTATDVVKVDSYRDEHHINLTWRSWMVVLQVNVLNFLYFF